MRLKKNRWFSIISVAAMVLVGLFLVSRQAGPAVNPSGTAVAERKTPARQPAAPHETALDSAPIHFEVAQTISASPKTGGEPAFITKAKHDASFGVVADLYGTLIAELGLGEKMTKEFLEDVCRERMGALDVAMAARASGVPNWHREPAVEKLMVAAATAEDAAIRELLGVDGYQRFEDYRTSTTLRTTLNQLSDQLDGGNALTEGQIRELSQMIVALQSPQYLPRTPVHALLELTGIPVSDEIIEAARPILTAPQLTALTAVQKSQILAMSARPTIGSPGVRNPGEGTH